MGAEGLPAGVTLNAENMAANLDTVPVVFEAAPDGRRRRQAGRDHGRGTPIPRQKIRSRFSQVAELVIGAAGTVDLLEVRGRPDGRRRHR